RSAGEFRGGARSGVHSPPDEYRRRRLPAPRQDNRRRVRSYGSRLDRTLLWSVRSSPEQEIIMPAIPLQLGTRALPVAVRRLIKLMFPESAAELRGALLLSRTYPPNSLLPLLPLTRRG